MTTLASFCFALFCLFANDSDAFLLPSSHPVVRFPIGFSFSSHNKYDAVFSQKTCPRVLRMEQEGVQHSRRSLTTRELLDELNERKIRYPPTATRQDLERLLTSDRNTSSQNEVALLAEQLTALGIRLPRYASRGDLERLLQDAQQNPENVTFAQRRTSDQSTKRRKKHYVTIVRLRKELDELGILYPPGASPRVLERLLRENDFSSKPQGEEASWDTLGEPPLERSPTRARRPERRSGVDPANHDISRTRESNQKGIRFSSTAAQQEREELLLAKEEEASRNQASGQILRQKNTSVREGDTIGRWETREADSDRDMQDQTSGYESENVGGESTSKHIASTEEIHASEAKRLGSEDRKEPSHGSSQNRIEGLSRRREATRERQPKDAGSERKQIYSGRRSGPASRDRARLLRRNHWSEVYGKSKEVASDAVFRTIPDITAKTINRATSRLSRAAEIAARKARHAARSARDFFAEDEYGVRDAEYEYVRKHATQKSVIIDVPVEPVVDERFDRSTKGHESYKYVSRARAAANSDSYQRQRVRKDSRSSSSAQEPRRRRSYPPPGSRTATSVAAKPASKNTAAAHSNLFRLPPAKTESVSEESTPSSETQKRRHRSSSDASRHIYTPYSHDDAASKVYRDAIDMVGDFFVNTADTILWGKLEDDEKELPQRKKAASRASFTRGNRKRSTSVNWKDRMEQRFDDMLGIHEEGEYYNRWASQGEQEEQGAGGNDAFSVAQGRSPKRRHHPRSKRGKVYDKPFWERDDVLSSLFGRSPPTGFDSIGVGNILPSIKTLARTIALVATKACEWASVRGSLPQPVVVVGVTSCVLSVGPGKRLLTLGLSLVAFRIFGELIHEGLYGHEDWDGDDGDDDEEEVEYALPDELG
jgi:hypothetical protein